MCLAVCFCACLFRVSVRQDVAPWQKAFPVFKCIEARGCDEGAAPGCDQYAGDTAYNCMESYGGNISTEDLKSCFRGTRVRELLVMNDIATLDAEVKWVPWFTVDGDSLVSNQDMEVIMGPGDKEMKRRAASDAVQMQFFLGKKICEAYVRKSGKPAPEGCYTFPQDASELGADPYTYFETANLTALSLKHQESGSYSQSSYMLTDGEMGDWAGAWVRPWVWACCLVVGVVLVGVWFCYMRVKSTPAPEHTSHADREKADQQQSLLSSADKP
jgi:hypothetical protein